MKTILRTAFGATAALISLNATAVPAKPGLIPFTRPDGSVIEVRLHGDENFHYYTTPDGNEILMPENGDFVRARVTPDGRLEKSKEAVSPRTIKNIKVRKPRGISGLFPSATFPAFGFQKALVVLVQYKDVSFNLEDPHDYFSRLLNEPGFDEYLATGSARDWFINSSGGKFTPQFDVYGPVTLNNNRSYYGGNDYYGNDQNPQKMAIEACRQLNAEVDFSEYDRDGDGYIDNVYVIYADRGEASGGGSNCVWPHSWEISSAEPGASYIFDGVRLDHYACGNEWDLSEAGIGYRPAGIGTFVHEFSHVMGLPDLYSTTYNSSFTPGAWSVMDYGPYNNDGCTPPQYSAFERGALGYLDPKPLPDKSNISLATIDKHDAYIINTSRSNEYFLLENRQQEGWDAYIPGHGLLVWHIDYNSSVWESNTVNNTPSHNYVDIIEADNSRSEYDRDGDSFPGASNVTSLSFTTSPSLRTWSNQDTGFSLSEITESNGKVLFRVNGGHEDLPAPVIGEPSEIIAGGFTASWEAVEGADGYTITIYCHSSDAPGIKSTLAEDDFVILRRINVGNVTTYNVTGLNPATEYRYTVLANDGAYGSPESEVKTVTTLPPTFDYFAPVATEAIEIDENSFTATWEPMEGATAYFLDVTTITEGEPKVDAVDFTDGLESLPSGWSSTSTATYGMSTYSGEAAPSLRLATDSDMLISAQYPTFVKNISFWHRGNATTDTEKLILQGLAGDEWIKLVEFPVVTEKGGLTIDYTLDRQDITRIRIMFRRETKGAVAIDDVKIFSHGEQISTPVYPTIEAGAATSYKVEGLTAATPYRYTVHATDGTYTSLKSNTIEVVTLKASAIDITEADSLRIAVSGRTIMADRNVTVYDLPGRVIASGSDIVHLPAAGLYIVKAEGSKAIKVVVK